MIRLHLHFKRRVARISREGTVGLALLALCLAFYLSALRPTQVRLDQLRANMASLHEKLQNTTKAMHANQDTPAEQLATYYKFFPAQSSTPVWLDKIYKAARDQNIRLEQGEYRANREKAGKLIRYQITMPVKGTYLQLRKFLAAVLTEIPIASLDHISFERQKIGDEAIDAKIKLTLYLDREA